MKKMKKLAWVVLGCVIALSGVSCKKSGSNLQGIGDNTIHYVEGTLHKVNVLNGQTPFVVNGQTDYEIFVDLSNPTMKAAINKSAGFVAEHVENATGAKLAINTEKPEGLSKNDYAIVYGYPDLFASLGLTMPSDDIGTTGYYIKTCGNVVFLQANGGDGYRMAGLAFLREVLGYDMITEDCVIYERNATKMPIMDIVERPDFDYRQIQNSYTSIEIYGTGMHSHSDIWIPINGWDMHNTLYYLPKEVYGDLHPEWYRADFQQVCYTAHGVADKYELMLETVFDVIKTRMAECPTLENISFSAMDGTGQDTCMCETCLLYKELYGTPAATCIYFMNDLNKLVQAHIAENEPGRIMNLTFFAYHDAEPAPVERKKITDEYGNVIWGDPIADENGQFQPLKRYALDEKRDFIKDANGNYVYETDENGDYVYLKCDEHVYPWLAPIYSKFTSSFYDPINQTYANNVASWYAVSSNVYVWIYGTNFSYYMYPYNTWSVAPETYRYLRECGVKYVWNQAQERNQSTAFTDLKDYIDSKFLFDVNADYAQVLDDYFNNYFLEASAEMRSLFELIQARSAYLEETVPTISGGIYDEIGEAEYWPRLLLEEMIGKIDRAYKAVEKYKVTNPELYTNLVKRIKKESIFPRYALCTHFGDYYSNIQEIRAKFRDDWNELGFSIYKEANGDMQAVFNSWGI